MALSQAVRTNFQTLLRAFQNGDACLLECTRKDNGEPVAIICAAMDTEMDDGQPGVEFVPFAYMPMDCSIYDLVDAPE